MDRARQATVHGVTQVGHHLAKDGRQKEKGAAEDDVVR